MLIGTLCFGASVAVCCSFANRLGQWLGVIDHPDGVRKRHARPTPLIGGIALMVPLILTTVVEALAWPERADVFSMFALAALGLMVLGWFDDRHQVAPAMRLLISTLLCTVVLVIEPELQLKELDFGVVRVPLAMLALPFTVLCLVGLQNAINMADGLNGLVIGLSIFWTTCLLLYAPPELALHLSFLLLGLFILLPYNLVGRLFLGDAGSYALGVSIGLLMIHVYHEAAGALPMLIVMLWLLVPVVDCLRVTLVRVLARRSPFLADSNHLHHRLSRLWPWPVSVLVYLALVAGPGFTAALHPPLTESMLLVALLGYASVLWRTRGRFVVSEQADSAAQSAGLESPPQLAWRAPLLRHVQQTLGLRRLRTRMSSTRPCWSTARRR